MERRELISALDEAEKQQRNTLKFRDLEKNRWYKVLECSDMLDTAYGKYFTMNLHDIEEDKNIKAFSITKLINEHNDLTGKYIKYKGLEEKKNKPGEFFHDISIIDI